MARFEKLEFGAKPVNDTEAVVRTRASENEVEWLTQADDQRRRGQYENALRLYSRALELDKSLAAGWFGQVRMLVMLDELKEADVWSRKALELFPNHGELLAGRSQAVCRLGDFKQAHVLCDGAISQAGQSAYRWIVRGELMLAGKQDVDRHCFDKARQIDGDWLTTLEIALVYLYYDMPSRALDRARQAVETGADSAYAWFVKARCETDLGLDTPAFASLQRCLELEPGHVEAEQLSTKLRHGGLPLFRIFRRLFGR